MKDLIPYRRSEEYEYLVEEIAAGYIEFTKEDVERRLRFKHTIAETIAKHPVYRKYGKNNQEFIINLAKDIKRKLGTKTAQRISKTSIYDMLQLYEAEPNVEKIVAKAGTYTKALQVYLGRDSSIVETKCRNCPLHCKK